VDVFFPGKSDSEGSGAASGNGRAVSGVLTQERPPAVPPAPEARAGDGRLPGERHAAHPVAPGNDLTVARTPTLTRPAPDGSGDTPGLAAESAPDGAAAAPRSDRELVPVPGAEFAELPVDAIRPNPRQPRQVFDEEALAELVHSVREIGILQPVVVRRAEPEGGEARYELIMGERRWRATKEAGLERIPAIIRDTADDQMLRDALLENLHRSELNPLEEAAAYQQLLEDFGCTHEELATKIGRSRPQISNTIRLLRLPPQVQRRVAAGVLSAGHARALLGLDDTDMMERLAARIVSEGLSVRAVEEIVALGDGPTAKPVKRRPRAGGHMGELNEVAGRLGDRLDTRVAIALGKTRGKLTIDFASVDDLNRILALMSPEVRGAFKD
jgi:ParB family chromosome partitioning protein